MSYIQVIRSKLQEFPPGLYGQLPASLQDIELSNTNITNLPSDMDEVWIDGMEVFYFEYSDVETFPDTLRRLPCSLIGNKMKELPGDLGSNSFCSFSRLPLSSNPLHNLPQEPLGDLTALEYLALEDTQPFWVTDSLVQVANRIFVIKTPFCNSLDPHQVTEKYGENDVLSCKAIQDRRYGELPLDIITPLRSRVGFCVLV